MRESLPHSERRLSSYLHWQQQLLCLWCCWWTCGCPWCLQWHLRHWWRSLGNPILHAGCQSEVCDWHRLEHRWSWRQSHHITHSDWIHWPWIYLSKTGQESLEVNIVCLISSSWNYCFKILPPLSSRINTDCNADLQFLQANGEQQELPKSSELIISNARYQESYLRGLERIDLLTGCSCTWDCSCQLRHRSWKQEGKSCANPARTPWRKVRHWNQPSIHNGSEDWTSMHPL